MKLSEHETIGQEICFDAIGVVENNFSEPADADDIRTSESRIFMKSNLIEACHGMEPGQRLLVIYYFHLSEGGPLRQHPRGDESRPKRGAFMLRTPDRPNPIGLTEVELIEIHENVLRVCGLDAINGSPVLDIKPA